MEIARRREILVAMDRGRRSSFCVSAACFRADAAGTRVAQAARASTRGQSMVTQADILTALKELVVDSADSASPGHAPQLAALRDRIDSINAETPLAKIGWDSIQMTWVLIALEERFSIDTSMLSLFDMFSVGDLLRELQPLVNQARANG
jgi:acyl carrier protein